MPTTSADPFVLGTFLDNCLLSLFCVIGLPSTRGDWRYLVSVLSVGLSEERANRRETYFQRNRVKDADKRCRDGCLDPLYFLSPILSVN
jgi:hypothetical protein